MGQRVAGRTQYEETGIPGRKGNMGPPQAMWSLKDQLRDKLDGQYHG